MKIKQLSLITTSIFWKKKSNSLSPFLVGQKIYLTHTNTRYSNLAIQVSVSLFSDDIGTNVVAKMLFWHEKKKRRQLTFYIGYLLWTKSHREFLFLAAYITRQIVHTTKGEQRRCVATKIGVYSTSHKASNGLQI